MFAPSPAVRPFAGGVPRRAATAPSDASERASGKKRPRVAPARDSSACLTKMIRNRNSVVTAAAAGMELLTVGGERSSQELLQKRLASELDALRGLLKKAELISRGGEACKGGAPTAGKKERFLASKSNQRAKPIEGSGGNAPSAKRRKISTLAEQKQKQKQIPAPRMSPEERNQLAGRLSSLCGELPGHIVEFLQKHFGDADSHGEIEINIDSVEDLVLFELKTRLDKFAEESKDDKLAEESKGEVVLEQEEEEYIDICGLSPIIETGNVPSSSSSGDSDSDSGSGSESDSDQMMATSAQPPSEPASGTAQSTAQAESVSGESIGVPAPVTVAVSEVAQSGEAKKVQAVQRAAPKPVSLAGLLYRAKVRRELLEMERAALPDESIHPRDLQRLGIMEYGHPSLMRQLGLVLKVDA